MVYIACIADMTHMVDLIDVANILHVASTADMADLSFKANMADMSTLTAAPDSRLDHPVNAASTCPAIEDPATVEYSPVPQRLPTCMVSANTVTRIKQVIDTGTERRQCRVAPL